MTADVFTKLLDRHLKLAERVEAPNPEQARSEVQTLIADIDDALDSGALVQDSARRMAQFRGQWQTYLATSSAPASAAAPSPTTVPLASILRSLSAGQAWSIGGAVAIFLAGTFALGRHEAQLESQASVSTLTSQLAAEKSRADGLANDVARQKDAEQSRSILVQERRLAALILRVHQLPRAAQLRKELASLLTELETERVVVMSSDSTTTATRVEVVRTGEVWMVPGK